MDEVLEGIAQAGRAGERVALATIIATRGSSPRGPGSRLLLWPDGRLIGTVGGGCGEAEVIRTARDVLDDGVPRLVEVDLTADAAADEGMVCGGIMEVFVEPLA